MSNSQKFLGGVLLAMIMATSLLLLHLKAHQRLGEPGVKTRPIPGTNNLEVLLPETLPGFKSEIMTNGEATLQKFLPPDTSYRVRAYLGDSGFFSELSVVLMGSDRTSIHDPEICLPGQGWDIDHSLTTVAQIPVEKPFAYVLPAVKITGTKVAKDSDGNTRTLRGIYVYWFVDATHYTEKSWKWKVYWIPRDLMLNGVLERWAYVSYFSVCPPGQEAATFEKMKKFIAMSVPEFQLVPNLNPSH